jgi:hypothetical protein
MKYIIYESHNFDPILKRRAPMPNPALPTDRPHSGREEHIPSET